MKITVTNIYGDMPMTMSVLICFKLREFAKSAWKAEKNKFSLWKRMTGKERFVREYVGHYLHVERHSQIQLRMAQ